ncbi:MAG: hypothetical protein K2Q24_11610 [Chitinophagaceae bacterium]|jgi:hypothetical protein|nr:hypothetical protein [Chitinophagaceae bacterium]
MKKPVKNIVLLCLLFTVLCLHSTAQQKPAPTLKPPPLQSFWGSTKGGNLPLEMVLGIIDSALWVMDDKKVRYRISRFMIVYKSKDKFEDEKTGEIKTRFNITSANFKNSGLLSSIWQKSLYEQIKKDDELMITDIIVQNNKGSYFAAPDIIIRIQ